MLSYQFPLKCNNCLVVMQLPQISKLRKNWSKFDWRSI